MKLREMLLNHLVRTNCREMYVVDEKTFFRGVKNVEIMLREKMSEDIWRLSTIDEKIKIVMETLR